jgi:hypothetical protein
MSNDIPTIQNLETVFEKVIGAAVSFAGICLFVLLLVGGVKYITSGGDPKATEGAQKTKSNHVYIIANIFQKPVKQ